MSYISNDDFSATGVAELNADEIDSVAGGPITLLAWAAIAGGVAVLGLIGIGYAGAHNKANKEAATAAG